MEEGRNLLEKYYPSGTENLGKIYFPIKLNKIEFLTTTAYHVVLNSELQTILHFVTITDLNF